MPALRSADAVIAKWARIGATMKAATARKSSMIAKTRCRLFDCKREARDEQRGCDGGAQGKSGQCRGDQDERLVGGQRDPEHDDSSCEQHHADQRQEVHRPFW